MKGKKLLSFTDTKAQVLKRKTMFKKLGYKSLSIKKEAGGYSLLGKKSKKKVKI